MRRIGLLTFLLLLLSSPVWAQTATVSGTLRDAGGAAVTSNAFIRFELMNFTGLPTVSGSGTAVRTIKDFAPDGSGLLSGAIYRNDNISPANTFWRVCNYYGGSRGKCSDYRIAASTFNLDTATPLSPSVGNNPIGSLLGIYFGDVCRNATPGPPPTGQGIYYELCSDKNPYFVDDTGRAFALGGTTSGLGNNNAWSGSETHSGTETFANINGCITVTGSPYALTDVGIAAAIAAAGANGQVCLPPGTYSLAATITVSAPNVTVNCSGPFTTTLNVNHTSDAFVITGQHLQMRNCGFLINTTSSRSGSALFNIQAAQGLLNNISIVGNGTTPTNGQIAKMTTSAAGSWSFETMWITVGTWTNGWQLQSLTGSTVAGTYFRNILSFTGVTYTNYLFDFDAGVDTVFIESSQNGATGNVINIHNSGGSIDPRFIHFLDDRFEAGGSSSGTILTISKGRDIRYLDGYLASATTAANITGGSLIEIANNVISTIGQHGIILAGPGASLDVNILNNHFEDVGFNIDNTYDGIQVAAGSVSFSIIHNMWKQGAANHQKYGIELVAGGTNSFEVAGNDFFNAAFGTAAIINGASGATQHVYANHSSGITSTFNGFVLPAVSDQAVGRATTDTLSNKVLAAPTITGLTNGTGLQLFSTATTCTTPASVGGQCTTGAITLPAGYGDTNYRAVCTGVNPTNQPLVEYITKSNTTFTITLTTINASAATFSSFDCTVGHN